MLWVYGHCIFQILSAREPSLHVRLKTVPVPKGLKHFIVQIQENLVHSYVLLSFIVTLLYITPFQCHFKVK